MMFSLRSALSLCLLGLAVPVFAAPLGEADDLIERFQAKGLVADEKLGERVIQAVVHSFDPGAIPVTESTRQSQIDQRAGLVFDVGLTLALTNGHPVITIIGEGSPAEAAGLEVEGQLRLIDGENTEELGLHALANRLRARSAAAVELVWRFPAGIVQTARVERVAQTLPAVAYGEVLPFALGLLRIQHLHPGSGAEVLSQLQDWHDAGLYGVVIDLRGADGEDMESVEVIGGALAKAGDLLFAFRDGADQDLQVALAKGGSFSFPIMVLIDEETGGAAEVLAAVLRDSVRGAMVFGQPTRGDFLLREAVEVAEGLSYLIATRRLVTGDGTVYTGRDGVRPDVMVVRQEAGTTDFRAERSRRRQVVEEEVEQQKLHVRTRGDAALRRSVDVLLGLKALDIRSHSRAQP